MWQGGSDMAMEMFVLSDRELSSIAEWQTAIDAEGYPVRLDHDIQLETHAGFLPAHLCSKSTGFECNHFPATEFIREIRKMSNVNIGHDWKCVLAFRWRGDLDELQAACMAAAAYASAVNGVVFDEQDANIRSAAEARENVQKIVHDIPKIEAVMRESGGANGRTH
jgi:hypothetical protein